MTNRACEPGPRVRIWRSSALGGSEFLAGEFADYAYDPHVHESACFALITEGAIRIRVRGCEFIARMGDLFAIDADGVHAGWPIDAFGWKQRTLYVRHEQLAAAIAGEHATARPGALAAPIIRDTQLAALFARLHRCSEEPSPIECEELCLRFAARLFRRHMREAPALEPVRREHGAVRLVQTCLEQNLATPAHLSDLARMGAIPPFRL